MLKLHARCLSVINLPLKVAIATSAFKTCLIVAVIFNQVNMVLVPVTATDSNNMILSEFTILGHLQDYFVLFYGDVSKTKRARMF